MLALEQECRDHSIWPVRLENVSDVALQTGVARADVDYKGMKTMLFKKLLFMYVAACVLLPGAGHAEIRHEDVGQTVTRGLNVSPELMQLLAEEMQSIEKGVMSLVPAMASGQWDEVSDIGTRIHDSYIMKKKLSSAQIEELHHSLPAVFREMDQNFHHAAKKLAHAARLRNAEVVNFYFYKLTEACVSCHAKFAIHRFPGLARDYKEEEHRD